MRALIVGDPSRRPNDPVAASSLHLSDDETVLGRQARLLTELGITDVAPIGTIARADRESSDDEVLLVDRDLVFDADLLRRVVLDPRPDLAVRYPGTPESSAMPPLCKLSASSFAALLRAIGSHSEDTGAALSEVIRSRPIGALSTEGHFVRAVTTHEEATSAAYDVRRYDIQQQQMVLAVHGEEPVGALMRELGVHRPLLLIGEGLRSAELTVRLTAPELTITQFARVSQRPTYDDAIAATRVFDAENCDGILVIGDDAAIDLAKCVKLFVGSPNRSYVEQVPRHPSVKLVAVPRGSGGGSESVPSADLMAKTGVMRFASDCMLPDRVVLAPKISTASTTADRRRAGLAVLARGVDAAVAANATDDSRRLALKAVEQLARSLFAFVNSDDASAHLDILRAANNAGKASALSTASLSSVLGAALAEATGIDARHATALCAAAAWRELGQRMSTAPESAPARAPRDVIAQLGRLLGVRSLDGIADVMDRLLALFDLRAVELPPLSDADSVIARVDPTATGHASLAFDTDELTAVISRVLETAAGSRGENDTHREIDVLTRFAGFAQRYDVTYYLHGETLRDSVVHGQLTPWSSELTIAIPRTSFDRLRRLRDRLPPGMTLDDPVPGPRNAAGRPRLVAAQVSDSMPVGITIHVLEGVSGGRRKWVQGPAVRMLHEYYSAIGEQPARKGEGALRGSAHRAARRVNPQAIDRVWQSRLGRVAASGPTPRTYVDVGSNASFDRSHFPGSWFRPGKSGTLNDVTFTIPSRATSVLSRAFGADYRSVAKMRLDTPLRDVTTSQATLVSVPTTTARRDWPFISVVVPVYNVERYLPACLDSLCEQDYERYEIIAVNDGSPDASQSVLDDFASRYADKLRIVVKDNGGLSDARNAGLAVARGEYVAFVDSDDTVSPHFLRRMAEKIRATDSDIVVCAFNDYWSGENRYERRYMGWLDSYGHSVEERPELLVAVRPYAWNKIYRRSLFTDHGIDYPRGQAFEDSATTYNLMLEANRIEFVNEALYFYRRDNAESITRDVNASFLDVLKSFERTRQYYTRRGKHERFRDELQEIMRRVTGSRITGLEGFPDGDFTDGFLDAVYDYLDGNEPGWAENPYFKELMRSPKHRDDPRNRALPSRADMKSYLAGLRLAQADREDDPDALSTAELGRMLQRESLEILLRIDAFCSQHGLTYYLAEGTLLGAARHQGFVPWDDDIDICMPRTDYERFSGLMQTHPDPDLRLFNERTFPKYHLTFTKIVASQPSEFTTMFMDVPDEYKGPAVDVFPLDAGVRAANPRREHTVRWLRDVLLFKVGYLTLEKRPKQRGRYLASRVLGFRFLQNAIQRRYRIHEAEKDTGYVVNFASSYPVAKEKFRSDWFGEPPRAPFEGHRLPVPADSDAVLRTTYGDYMKLPPVEKRVFRHRPHWRGESLGNDG